MGFRFGVILLLLVVAMVAESSPFGFNDARLDIHAASSRGSVKVGDFIDEGEEMMLDSEAARRVLAQRRTISYGALARNNVPCNRRGSSYYNCNKVGPAQPYVRRCTRATRCARG